MGASVNTRLMGSGRRADFNPHINPVVEGGSRRKRVCKTGLSSQPVEKKAVGDPNVDWSLEFEHRMEAGLRAKAHRIIAAEVGWHPSSDVGWTRVELKGSDRWKWRYAACLQSTVVLEGSMRTVRGSGKRI